MTFLSSYNTIKLIPNIVQTTDVPNKLRVYRSVWEALDMHKHEYSQARSKVMVPLIIITWSSHVSSHPSCVVSPPCPLPYSLLQ